MKQIVVTLLLLCINTYCNAQKAIKDYDTIVIADESHHVNGFTLYGIIPNNKPDSCWIKTLTSCKVYVQVYATFIIDNDGNIINQQTDTTRIKIIAIKNLDYQKYLYLNGEIIDKKITNIIDDLTGYYREKLSNVYYYLSVPHKLPSPFLYYYVDIL